MNPDFVAHFGEMATVWGIEAVSDAAKEFAAENFIVEDWQGVPTNFFTDWRPARDLCARLADEGFTVCHKQPGREGMGVWQGR
jgi:hypothetical protein